MSSAPARGLREERPGDWHPLAKRVAAQARDFVDGVGALATGQGGDEVVPLLLLEVSQILLAGAQLGASQDVIPPGNWEPDVGADPVNRADCAAEDMVATAKLADLLNGRHILGLLDHADHRGIPPRVAADTALILLGHVPAYLAEPDLVGHLHQDGSEPPHVRGIGAEQVERDPLGTLRPHARQPPKLVDEVLHHSLVHVSPHPPGPGRADQRAGRPAARERAGSASRT